MGLPVLVAAVWWGAPGLPILVLVLAVLGVREFYALMPSRFGALPTLLGAVWAICLVLAAQSGTGLGDSLLISGVVLAVGAVVALLWMIAFYLGPRPLETAAYLIGGPVYAGFLLGHVLWLRNIGEVGDVGRDWLLLSLLMVFATDTGAYLIGRAVGRHRMAPGISPGKTWEGATGGFVSAVVAIAVFGWAFDVTIHLWQQLVIGATVGVVSQMGDLFESKLKRIADVKDSGSIIPGHGGVLDRLDSVLVSIPVVYYLLATVFQP